MSAKRHLRKASSIGVAAGLVALSATHLGSAAAAPKADDQSASGDTKIHNIGTLETDNRNEPKVCLFTLVGDNFDAGESLTYEIRLGEPFKDAPDLSGIATAGSDGSWSTAQLQLAPGHWKVDVDDGESHKFKVFKNYCDDSGGNGDPDPTPTPTPDPTPEPTPDPTPTPTPDPTPGPVDGAAHSDSK